MGDVRSSSWRGAWTKRRVFHFAILDLLCAAILLSDAAVADVGPGQQPAGCASFTSCGDCRSNQQQPCTWCPSRQSCLGQDMVAVCRDPALMCPVEDDKDTGKEARCSGAVDCASCMRLANECGWCPAASRCQLRSDECDKGWSNTTCYAVCPTDKTPLHDTAGVVQLGAQTPRPVSYLPGESCVFTIWPLLDASGSRRSTLIRLQFEYVDLGPGDRIEIFSNTVDGPRLVSVTGSGDSVVNRIITSRSAAVVVKFISEGSKGGTGFRLYYRVIQGSPLDIYLISAIIVTSILTCVLCSCCCNNCVAVIADHSARITGAAQTRALSAEEKARLPTSQYNSTDKHTYDSKECCICLSDFELGELVRELPCDHIFHPTCIDTWLEFNTLCPLCKKDVREGRQAAGAGAGGERTRLARLRRAILVSLSAWARRRRAARRAASGGGPRQVHVPPSPVQIPPEAFEVVEWEREDDFHEIELATPAGSAASAAGAAAPAAADPRLYAGGSLSNSGNAAIEGRGEGAGAVELGWWVSAQHSGRSGGSSGSVYGGSSSSSSINSARAEEFKEERRPG